MDHSGHAGHMGHNHHSMDHSMHSNHGAALSDMDMDMNDTMPCMSSGSHGMGSMAFHGGYCETILFTGWEISSVGGLIGSMVGIILMAAVYEGIKYYREYLFWKAYNSLQYHSMPANSTQTSPSGVVGEVIHKQPPRMLCWPHAFQTILHMIQLVMAYLLMLIFMTYNYWLALAVMLGGGLGYFLFGWKKAVIVDVTEHCH